MALGPVARGLVAALIAGVLGYVALGAFRGSKKREAIVDNADLRLASGVEVRRVPAMVAEEDLPIALLRILVVRGRTRVSQERAQALLQRARRNPERFAQLIGQVSEDPGSRQGGGMIGEVDLDSPAGAAGLSGETIPLIAAQKPGEIGGPYPGARGYYLVRVERRSPRPADGGAP